MKLINKILMVAVFSNLALASNSTISPKAGVRNGIGSNQSMKGSEIGLYLGVDALKTDRVKLQVGPTTAITAYSQDNPFANNIEGEDDAGREATKDSKLGLLMLDIGLALKMDVFINDDVKVYALLDYSIINAGSGFITGINDDEINTVNVTTQKRSSASHKIAIGSSLSVSKKVSLFAELNYGHNELEFEYEFKLDTRDLYDDNYKYTEKKTIYTHAVLLGVNVDL